MSEHARFAHTLARPLMQAQVGNLEAEKALFTVWKVSLRLLLPLPPLAAVVLLRRAVVDDSSPSCCSIAPTPVSFSLHSFVVESSISTNPSRESFDASV